MSYSPNFSHADDVIRHLTTVVPAISDPLIKARYTGFVTVAAVTVYEQAVKEIIIDFGRRKHRVLGNFTESYFDRINGRIRINDIKNDYVVKFGEKYKTRFERNLARASKEYLNANSRSIQASYANLITWRNDFVHSAHLQSMSTFEETVDSYQDGKEVTTCLSRTMTQ